jgi:hypothetical protein
MFDELPSRWTEVYDLINQMREATDPQQVGNFDEKDEEEPQAEVSEAEKIIENQIAGAKDDVPTDAQTKRPAADPILEGTSAPGARRLSGLRR